MLSEGMMVIGDGGAMATCLCRWLMFHAQRNVRLERKAAASHNKSWGAACGIQEKNKDNSEDV